MTRILLLCSMLMMLQQVSAQKDVYFKINHRLGANAFAFNQNAMNDLGDQFQVTRLQYYISDIVLHHDGTQTPVTGKFLLVDASGITSELLGNYGITNLDSISFGIGVGSNENHLDPSTYASSHPLAHQVPSMHWGWTSGYRFIALEGGSGASMTDVFQMHSLGDVNYKMQTIVTQGNASSNNLDIIINADYEQALKTIAVSQGIVSHGETGAAQTVINNFNTDVFSDGSNTVSTTLLDKVTVAMYPNPVQIGQKMLIEMDDKTDVSIQVYDLTGKLYNGIQYSAQDLSVQFKDKGTYIVTILKNQQVISTSKVAVYE